MNSKSGKSIRPLAVLQPFSTASAAGEANGLEASEKRLDIPAKSYEKICQNCECDCHDSPVPSSSKMDTTTQKEDVAVVTEESSTDPVKIRIETTRDTDGPVVHKPVTINVKISKCNFVIGHHNSRPSFRTVKTQLPQMRPIYRNHTNDVFRI